MSDEEEEIVRAKEVKVLEAYLCDGWSQRRIQEDILGIDALKGVEDMRQ